MKKIIEGAGVLFIVAFVVAALVSVVFAPLAGVWAINTLFGTAIPYTFWTWLAALVLLGLTRASITIRS